jgi:uncharacterized protein (DUF302 family)
MLLSPHFRLKIFSCEWVTIHWFKIVLILFFSITNVSTNAADADNDKARINSAIKNISVPIFSIETDKKFDDVIEDLLIVIAEQNFRVNQHARIGKAIAKRNNISFPPATVLHFCNLKYARQLLEIAPDYLLRMPCRISIWPKNGKSTIIEVWLLPEDDERTLEFAKKINAILINIVTFGAT